MYNQSQQYSEPSQQSFGPGPGPSRQVPRHPSQYNPSNGDQHGWAPAYSHNPSTDPNDNVSTDWYGSRPQQQQQQQSKAGQSYQSLSPMSSTHHLPHQSSPAYPISESSRSNMSYQPNTASTSGAPSAPLSTSTHSVAQVSPQDQFTPENKDTAESGSNNIPPSASTDTSASAGPAKKKRKKSTIDKSVPAAGSPSEADKEKEKRTKTGRACDACRTKKIRCDILQSDEVSFGLSEQPICAHCKHNDLECTFFLPITETRFKKKRQAEDPPSSESAPILASNTLNRAKPGQSLGDSPNFENMGGGVNSTSGDRGRIEGPTSISFLLHTTIPAIASEAYDLRHHNSWEVLEDGNGMIRVNAPPSGSSHADADPLDPTRAHNRLNKPVLSAQTMSLLVNAYFTEVAPLFPIISRADFASKSTPSPLLLYSICGVGATRRQFPREVFAGVRGVINGILRSNDILSDARFENVQALLLLAQVGDLHAQPTAATASASLIRTGAAIRMAQDLGLHRESSLRATTAQDLAYVELRRRVWATCVIMDRWYGAALGIPLLVDLLDCDVLLPAPYQISSDSEPSSWPIDVSFMALTEHLKLSILIGRVLKTIYSPTGLKHTTDAQLEGLVENMNVWMDGLPSELKFQGPTSSHEAGLLHLGYTGLQFLFWRVFMRITYSCPPHLSFVLPVPHWSKMITWSREALEWLDQNDDALDTLFVFPYAATSCALIQYHTWARRGDTAALETLKLVKETAIRWEHTVQPDQMSIRRKTCETMTLLYEAALKTDPDSIENKYPSKFTANPTAGVMPRHDGFSKLVFHKDVEREGGGVFIAKDEAEKKASGLDSRDVVLASEIPASQPNTLNVNNNMTTPHLDNRVMSQPLSHVGAGNRMTNVNQYQMSQVQDLDFLQNMQNISKSASNVNPLIDEDERNVGGNVQNLGHMMDIHPEMASHLTIPYSHNQMGNPGAMAGQGDQMPNLGFQQGNGYSAGQNQGQRQGMGLGHGNFDPSFLDSLPVSTFDWESWSSYFDKFLPAANQSFETMQ